MRVPVRRRLAIGALALLTAGCGAGSNDPPGGRVTVFAAASLTESFTSVAHGFEAKHAGVRVRLIFGPSSDLARQILAGAAADVYAAASSESVAPLTAARLTGGAPVVFARGRLELAVPAGNPARVRDIHDLGRTGVTFAQCAVEVPCGAATRRLFDSLGLSTRPVTYERDVKAVLAKVRLGEVDAGLVYRTDIRAETGGRATPRATGIEIPQSANALTDYPIVTIARGRDGTPAAAFVQYVLSPDGRAVLADAGFDAP